MHEVEDLNADRTNVCLSTMEAEGDGWDPVNNLKLPTTTYTQ